MFKRVFSSMLVLVVTCMMFAASVMAEDVFVTKYGKKYHKKDSRFIKGKETVKMDREEAEAEGYKPSSDFLNEDESAESKSE